MTVSISGEPYCDVAGAWDIARWTADAPSLSLRVSGPYAEEFRQEVERARRWMRESFNGAA